MRGWAILAALLLVTLAGCEPIDPQVELEKAAEAYTERLPQTIDAHVQLVEVRAETLEVVYVYELSGLNERDLLERINQLEEHAVEKLTADKEKLGFFVEHAIPLTYICNTASGDELVRFSIRVWEL